MAYSLVRRKMADPQAVYTPQSPSLSERPPKNNKSKLTYDGVSELNSSRLLNISANFLLKFPPL
jgi:hypothetical protein